MKEVELLLDEIELPELGFVRVITKVVEGAVEEYAQAMEEGVEFDPIVVWKRGDGRYKAKLRVYR